eukprot:TRINITY_DN732_c0_g1_i1.p2 TRINITY_DN732_c0_g1~~TRINITY_DN732_c0_g1_i1.p2  ORF type:complete len:300 (+),score=42.82 TRINITY_DN732_c0_g1_i1:85-984(+)
MLTRDQDKVIDLNIGGTLVSTTKGTLCLLEGSKLAQFFAVDNNPEFLRDKQGRIFLDYDPKLFVPLLDYLRRRRISGSTAPPVVPDKLRSQFDELLVWLGVQSYLWISGNRFDMALKSETLTFKNECKVASGVGSAIGVELYESSLVYAKFRVEHEDSKMCSLYLGAVTNQEIQYMGPVEPHLILKRGSYICRPGQCVAALYGEEGFTMTGTLPMFFTKPLPNMPALPRKYKSGTEVEVVLNCQLENMLRISDNQEDSYGKKESMNVPPDCQWRFLVMAMDPKVTVHFIDCTRVISLAE